MPSPAPKLAPRRELPGRRSPPGESPKGNAPLFVRAVDAGTARLANQDKAEICARCTGFAGSVDRVTSIDDQIRACNRVGGVAGEKERCGPYFLWKGESPRPSSASRAPLLAKSSAMALPMPAPAPVTMATLPSSMNPAAAWNPKAYRSFTWDIGAENFPTFQTFKNRAKSSGEAVCVRSNEWHATPKCSLPEAMVRASPSRRSGRLPPCLCLFDSRPTAAGGSRFLPWEEGSVRSFE